MERLYKFLLYFAITTVVVAGVTLAGCTKVDDTLGGGIVPPSHQMKFGTHTMKTGGFDSYIGIQDSIPTNNLLTMRIGTAVTEEFGRTTCSYVGQISYSHTYRKNMNPKTAEGKDPVYVWSILTTEQLEAGLFFGYNAKKYIKEAKLSLYITEIIGENGVEQLFNVYGLSQDIGPKYTYEEKYPKKTSDFKQKHMVAYYPSFDPTTVIDNGVEPLFTFTMKNEIKGEVIKVLTPTTAGKEYLKKLAMLEEITTPEKPNPTEADIKRGVMYNDDNIFRQHIKGFYIVPVDKTLNGAIYEIDLAKSSETQALLSITGECDILETGLVPDKGKNSKDSIRVSYIFDDNISLSYLPNTSIGTFEHDYTGTVINKDIFWDETEGAVNQQSEKLYVQGMFGVSSYIELNDQFIEELKSLLIEKDENGKTVREWQVLKINKALMRIWIDKDENKMLDAAPIRLGLYENLKGKTPFSFPYIQSLTNTMDDDGETLLISDYAPRAISDYLYRSEGQQTAYSFGGYINRSEGHGYYEMYITSYISTLVNTKTTEDEETEETPKRRGIWVAPALTTSNSAGTVNTEAYFTNGQVILRNDKPAQGGGSGTNIKEIEVELTYTLMKPKEAK